ncbi:glycoside hydrolase family 43 protein [Pedobacter ginsengiterrae]|uniref:glycoside hydrolase family 43 protein n=1 Tax=Pedobacter ginsengiterrae TaxID=871696 RepID=UPI0031DF446D
MRKCFTLFFLCIAITCSAQINLVNPILSGFYPDPSVKKVGDDYYLVNSTFSYFPGIPVFHSKDLKNWKQIGNVIDRPSQMNFLGDGVSRGLFAPSINFHNGTYYVTCTLIDRKGNFVVTAKSPSGPWSNPVWLPEVKGIDPSLFFDTDKAYIVYNSDAPDNKPLYSGHRTIRVYEFDPITLKVLGEEKQLVNGGVDISKKPVWIEGPHIFKRGDWYYLCAAEGGTSVNHSQVILRSKQATGPYLAYEKNPILTQRDLDPKRKNPVTSAGHAELVEGPDGNTYAVFLAVRPYEDDFYNIGRETFIAPVRWDNEWPIINPDFKEIQPVYKTSIKEVKELNTIPQSGNFQYRIKFEDKIDPALLFLRTLDKSWFKLSKADGITMNLSPETCMGTGNPAFIGKRQQHLICKASTELNFTARAKNEKAGLLIYQSEFNFYYLCKSIEGGRQVLQIFKGNKQNNNMSLIKQVYVGKSKIYLQIEADKSVCNFYYSNNAKDWKLLAGGLDGKYLSTKVAGGFVGSLFALYATSSGLTSDNKASFKWLDYAGKN